MDDQALKRKLIAMLAAESSGSDADECGEDEEDEECGEESGEPRRRPQLPMFESDACNWPEGSCGIESSFGVVDHALQLGQAELASLRRDCRVVFALGSSNWVSADATPSCALERLALAVFESRTRGATFDRSRSGAEWWAQVRTEGHTDEAIQFHWDVDERLCDR